MGSDAPGFDLVLDCADPQRLSAFWSEALGYRVLGELEQYVLLVPPEGDGPKLLLQGVPEGKAAKNRMHIDIRAADIEVEADRLAAIGASRGERFDPPQFQNHWIVMSDPEGNEFCVCSH
jgi:predicted enzyme related to lactoylglutathione lyase